MSNTFKRFFFVPLTVILILLLLFSFVACDENKEDSMTADVQISFIDKNDIPIVNTEISVQGISNTDIMSIYTTDSNGHFTVKNLGEKNITVIIHTEEESYRASYTITKSDLEQGEITIKFNDYEK